MAEFDPNGIGIKNGNICGLPKNFNESQLVILPIPWDVTVSYREGTMYAPELILEESLQIDLFDLEKKNFWEKGILFADISKDLKSKSISARALAKEAIALMQMGLNTDESEILNNNLKLVNQYCDEMVHFVFDNSINLLNNNKKIILLGGDHSTPLGYLKALNSIYKDFGILQIDAHADLRFKYEGFDYSHASIMYNALNLNSISKLVQVGVRDFCEEEYILIKNSNDRIVTFFDRNINKRKIKGESWHLIAQDIVKTLPQKVYISFDIDGLNPNLCPNTGTPVYGGLTIDEVFYIFDLILDSGKEIIGADLNEVGNNIWDANVGARILYRLSSILLSNNSV